MKTEKKTSDILLQALRVTRLHSLNEAQANAIATLIWGMC